MMKMNKWTMALAAAGVVSLSSVAQAQEAAAGADALAASTTLSGYVSTSYTAAANGDSAGGPQGYFRSAEDNNKFALDVVSLTLASAQGAGEYATGYTVQLWAGDAAGDIDTNESGTAADASTVELMQANIDLRLPIGNGLDLKVGQMGTVVGAETYDYNANAFYTRSFAFAAEPTHHTGILASYQLTDDLGVSVGLANSTDTATTNDVKDGGKATLIAVSYTTPDTLGVLGGTELYYGGVLGASNTADSDAEQDTHFLSASIPVPVEGLSYSVGWTVVDKDDVSGNDNGSTSVVSHYLGYALTEELTLNVRYEHGNVNGGTASSAKSYSNNADGLESISVGLDYALWDNVTSRIEWREDSATDLSDQEVVALNIVYNF